TMFVAPPGYQPVYSPRTESYSTAGPTLTVCISAVTPCHVSASPAVPVGRFFVNLRCAESESSDVALHFNPRFDGWDKVVFNSYENESWGSEEKIRDMPFSKGQPFEMVIMVTSQGYQVSIKVNGTDFYTFQHRIPVERVRALHVAGDVSIEMINVTGVRPSLPLYGPPQGGYPGGEGGMGSHCSPITLPFLCFFKPVPYSNMIPGGMYPKRTVIIRGMVLHGADRIIFNFMVSRSKDIALHINPRVKEGIVVRNSMIGGNWGPEDRELSLNPFMEGQYFDMSIRCGNQRFKVFVNGQHLCDFSHRLQPFTDIDMLEIHGDVQISYIHF
uniref:Galectin n=1 Tax=Mola mola TaxID=94237 RepID=A0A3Q3VX89_MOLML